MINDADSGVLLQWLEAAIKNKMPSSVILANFVKILETIPQQPEQTAPAQMPAAKATVPAEGRTVQRTEVPVEQPQHQPAPKPKPEPAPQPQQQEAPAQEETEQEEVPPPPAAKKENKKDKDEKKADDKKEKKGLPRFALRFKVFKE